MRENNFEKNIAKEMDSLRLRPSDAVWEHVEREIRRKKRRRVVVFFFVLIALSLLGYTSYYFLSSTTTNNNTSVASQNDPGVLKNKENPPVPGLSDPGTSSINSDNKSANDKNSVRNDRLNTKDSGAMIVIGQNKDNHTTSRQLSTTVKEQQSPVEKVLVKNTAAKKKNSRSAKKDSYPKQDVISDKAITANKSGSGNGIDKPIKQNETEDQPAVNENTTQPVAVINDATSDLDKTDSVVTGIATRETTATDTTAITGKAKTDSTTTITAASKKPVRKIKWALEAGAGVSGVQGEALSFTANRDRVYAAAPSLPSNAITNGFPSPYHPPSEVHNGPAFRIGASAELKVSKRSSFSAGLLYSYISNRIRVGRKTDSSFTFTTSQSNTISLNGVYGAVQQKDYSNIFHFLQVPLSYHLQLNRSNRMPLTLNLGASVSYLFATNALIYDQSAGGFYYKDKTAYNRLHFGLGGGLSLGFKGKSGREWSIGPDYLIDLTRQMKSAQFDGRYFFYGGIHAKWYLSK